MHGQLSTVAHATPDGECAKHIEAGSGGTAIGIADAGGVFFGDGDCLRAGGDVGDVARSDGSGAGVAGCAAGGGGGDFVVFGFDVLRAGDFDFAAAGDGCDLCAPLGVEP